MKFRYRARSGMAVLSALTVAIAGAVVVPDSPLSGLVAPAAAASLRDEAISVADQKVSALRAGDCTVSLNSRTSDSERDANGVTTWTFNPHPTTPENTRNFGFTTRIDGGGDRTFNQIYGGDSKRTGAIGGGRFADYRFLEPGEQVTSSHPRVNRGLKDAVKDADGEVIEKGEHEEVNSRRRDQAVNAPRLNICWSISRGVAPPRT
ncbi:hypothetical protein QP119_11180, partial [Corynebacterium frankenforstense]|uniref:adhesin domain containing protein n=1 Tax=Corynebacterium frankenforstense TaxID=1230998 RepID=UPI00254F2401